jgi:hypothetical protein
MHVLGNLVLRRHRVGLTSLGESMQGNSYPQQDDQRACSWFDMDFRGFDTLPLLGPPKLGHGSLTLDCYWDWSRPRISNEAMDSKHVIAFSSRPAVRGMAHLAVY